MSFSFSQLVHFHSTASSQDEQYSVAIISAPQALHSMLPVLWFFSFLNNYAAKPGLTCAGLTVTVILKLVRMSLHLFLMVTSVTPDRLDTSR